MGKSKKGGAIPPELQALEAQLDGLGVQKVSFGHANYLVAEEIEEEIEDQLRALPSLDVLGRPGIDLFLRAGVFFAGRARAEDAVRYWEEVLETDKHSAEALLNLMVHLHATGNAAEADTYLHRLADLRKAPLAKLYLAYWHYTIMQTQLGDAFLEEAFAYGKKKLAGKDLRRRDPDVILFWETMLAILLYRGAIGLIFQLENEVFPADLKSRDLTFNLATAHMQAGNYDVALAKFNEVLTAENLNELTIAMTYMNMGQVVILQEGDLDRGIHFTEMALNHVDNIPVALQNLALMYVQRDQLEIALETFQRAIDIYERYDRREQKLELALLYCSMVESLFNRVDFSEEEYFIRALDWCNQAIDAAPNILISYFDKILVYAHRDTWHEDMLEVLEFMESLDPASVFTSLAQAITYLESDPALARQAADAARQWLTTQGAGLPPRYQQLLPIYLQNVQRQLEES